MYILTDCPRIVLPSRKPKIYILITSKAGYHIRQVTSTHVELPYNFTNFLTTLTLSLFHILHRHGTLIPISNESLSEADGGNSDAFKQKVIKFNRYYTIT